MRPTLELLGLSYLRLKWVKYRLDGGDPRRALDLFGDLSPEFKQLMHTSRSAKAEAERYRVFMWAGYGVAGVAGCCLAVGMLLEHPVPLAVGAAVAAVAFVVDYQSYRCFTRMVAAYQSAEAPQADGASSEGDATCQS